MMMLIQQQELLWQVGQGEVKGHLVNGKSKVAVETSHAMWMVIQD